MPSDLENAIDARPFSIQSAPDVRHCLINLGINIPRTKDLPTLMNRCQAR
ncbi:hypothetical protein [Marinobacter santoriniensis]|nr:hypothetical protein [Marinobacter santoriniensis]